MKRRLLLMIFSCLVVAVPAVSAFVHAQGTGTPARAPVAAESTACAVRTVWEGPGGSLVASLSRDGKLLAFVDRDTGDLAVRDMATGNTRRVTNKGSWATSQESALTSAISPDGSRVAYSWRNSQRRYELRVIGTDGSHPEMIHTSDSADVFPVDWLPGGSEIVFGLLRPDGARAIALMRLADRTMRVIKDFDSHFTEGRRLSPDGRELYRAGLPLGVTDAGATASYSAALSPDGKRLAVSGPGTTANSHALLILPSEGGEPVRLGNSLREFVKIQTWTADGRSLLVTNRPDQVSTSELWRIPVESGEPQPSSLALQALGLYGFSLHPDGRRVAFSTGQNARDEVRVVEGCGWSAP